MMHADLPGFKKEDIHLHIDNGTLVLEAERKEEKTEDTKGYHIQERSWGKVSRSFRLPVNASTATDVPRKCFHYCDHVVDLIASFNLQL